MSKLTWSEKYQTWGIFRPWRRDPKTQEKIWAKRYGYRAWFIPVEELESEEA